MHDIMDGRLKFRNLEKATKFEKVFFWNYLVSYKLGELFKILWPSLKILISL